MKTDTLESFLKRIVVPMFPGAEVEISNFALQKNSRKTVASETPTRLHVRQNSHSGEYFSLTLRQGWDEPDKLLIEALLLGFDGIVEKAPAFLGQLEDFIVRRAIAKTVANNFEKQANTVESILDVFSQWSSQTYEGERVASGILINRNVSPNPSDLSFLEVMQEDFAKVLSDGVDSWWRVDGAGFATAFAINHGQRETPSEEGYFPLRYEPFARMSRDGTVGAALNRNGEILVFARGKLQFAKRRGVWLHFSHQLVVKQMHFGNPGSLALRRAIYESCLDVSFARSGGTL